MCGRYSIAIEPREIEEHFGARFGEPMRPRYNAAPSQRLPVILNADPRSIVLSPWGIKPPWLVKRDGLINVRAETLREKRTFQKELADRRCLIPADGFYEWQVRPGGKKAPYRIVPRAGGVFAFAGIWQAENQMKSTEPRFAIITTRANDLMRPIHLRMPVILTPDQERIWLSANTLVPELLALLEPAPSKDLRAFEVSPEVNRATTDTPKVMEPV
jgi:putative SOS response-associated peptidase YedK